MRAGSLGRKGWRFEVVQHHPLDQAIGAISPLKGLMDNLIYQIIYDDIQILWSIKVDDRPICMWRVRLAVSSFVDIIHMLRHVDLKRRQR